MAIQEGSANHPCPKPAGFMNWLIQRVTVAPSVILDPFMGSGTVAESALHNGRRFVGYELSEAYHAEIARRLGLFGGAA